MRGIVDAPGPDATPLADGSSVAFRISGVAAFRVEEGRRIVVDAVAGQAEQNVRLYLLGTAMGLLLLQRGDVPLHANAIGIGAGAVAVMGPSGIGKSTLASLAAQRAMPLLGDDVAVIRTQGDGSATVSPGLSRLRLWKDTMEAHGHDPDQWPRAYVSGEPWDKFDLAITPSVPGDRALRSIYHLEIGDKLEILGVGGAEAAGLLIENVYRGDWVTRPSERDSIFRWAIDLCGCVPIYRLRRPWGLDVAGRVLEAVVSNEEETPILVRPTYGA